ncbi:MAG: Methyltransferase domain [Roseibaca calidilacus]|uniref:Methyltransferase domain n=1 Tax=Roseibaca calidilacus TaxID=1666912 RepID=A0A0N8K6U1_9RHOB|nr:class I SAM-dependent methyltransferase [Roseibaca calidilacus]KPP89881.1 MAG: Methyltransferase domain [Roseibaca calidilacus]CUX80929.1 Methyltransferase domain-containing protein [Roseibaca calidilacus]
MDLGQHWNTAYTARAEDALTWFEDTPAQSLALVRQYLPKAGTLLDVGGGASRLADHALGCGAGAVTVLDLSRTALQITRQRLADAPVTLVAANICNWSPDRAYDLWHDRAVFHFLTEPADQQRYLQTLNRALRPGGVAIIATFDLTGPDTCSNLPVQRYAPETLAKRMAELAPGLLTPLQSLRHAHRTPKGNMQDFQFSVFRKSADMV